MKGERLHEGLELPRDVLPPMVVTETIRHNPWYTVTAGCFFINGRGWMERRFLLSIWKDVETIFWITLYRVFCLTSWVGHRLSSRRWWIKLVLDKLYLERRIVVYIPSWWLLDRFVKSIRTKRDWGWFHQLNLINKCKLSTGLASAPRLILSKKTLCASKIIKGS